MLYNSTEYLLNIAKDNIIRVFENDFVGKKKIEYCVSGEMLSEDQISWTFMERLRNRFVSRVMHYRRGIIVRVFIDFSG
jgi:hypothetical protein